MYGSSNKFLYPKMPKNDLKIALFSYISHIIIIGLLKDWENVRENLSYFKSLYFCERITTTKKQLFHNYDSIIFVNLKLSSEMI